MTYSVSSCKLVTSFLTVLFSFFLVKMVNHYEVYVIVQDIKHQLQENILPHFLHYKFHEIFIKLRRVFDPTQNYLLEAFAALPNHIDHEIR